MLYHVIKILLVGYVLVLCSCDSELSDYYALQEQLSRDNEVRAVHKEITDSITSWVSDSLLGYKHIFFESSWNVNNIIFFNTDKNKFVSTLNNSSTNWINKQADNTYMIYGVKIKGNWYFFQGATYILPRGTWQNEFYDPMTSEELDYLGYDFFLSYYIKKTWNGKFVPKEEAFDKEITTKVILGKPSFTKEESDSFFIAKWNSKYDEKILPKYIDHIKKEMKARVRPPEPEPEPYTTWEKIFGRKPKIFESEEWKNRYKKEK